MHLKFKTLLAGVLCLGFAAQANALPIATPTDGNNIVQPFATDVQYRRHGFRGGRYDRYERRYRRRGGGDVGAAIGLGIVGSLIAGGIAESDAEDRSGRCAATFRTYNPETGTYIATGGYERRCPYL